MSGPSCRCWTRCGCLLRRADVQQALSRAGESARVGGACLAIAIISSSPSPEIVLALVGVALLVVGGAARSAARTSNIAFRLAGPLLTVIAARVLAGTAAAALAGLLVALGAWLQVRLAEATVGLAIFAGTVTVLGGASMRVVVAFWLLGVSILLVRSMAASAWRRLSIGSSLKAERRPVVPLRPEN